MTVPRDARGALRSATPGATPGEASAAELLRDLSAQIVEVATDAIISKDREGVITSWNLGAERLYGYAADEAVGIPISFLIPKELKGEEHRLLERVLDGEHIDYYETRRSRKDGSKVSVSLTLFALRDELGEIVGAAAIAHDISRQVAAQDELRRSEGRYRQILESAHAGIWQVNPETVTDYANPSLARMLGYTVEELLGRPLSDFLNSERLSTAQESMQRQSAGSGERLEQTFRHKDGSEVQTLMSVNEVLDDAGDHVGNLAIVTDVTEQRMAEAHLREAEEFLAGLSASMDEGLLVLGVDGRIATLNRAAERSLGYSAEELAGRTLCGALGCGREEQRSCTARHCRLAEVGSSPTAVRIDDVAFVCKDGTRLAVDLSAAPLGGDEHGGFSGRVVVFRDISERRRSEEQAQREARGNELDRPRARRDGRGPPGGGGAADRGTGNGRGQQPRAAGTPVRPRGRAGGAGEVPAGGGALRADWRARSLGHRQGCPHGRPGSGGEREPFGSVTGRSRSG